MFCTLSLLRQAHPRVSASPHWLQKPYTFISIGYYNSFDLLPISMRVNHPSSAQHINKSINQYNMLYIAPLSTLHRLWHTCHMPKRPKKKHHLAPSPCWRPSLDDRRLEQRRRNWRRCLSALQFFEETWGIHKKKSACLENHSRHLNHKKWTTRKGKNLETIERSVYPRHCAVNLCIEQLHQGDHNINKCNQSPKPFAGFEHDLCRYCRYLKKVPYQSWMCFTCCQNNSQSLVLILHHWRPVNATNIV